MAGLTAAAEAAANPRATADLRFTFCMTSSSSLGPRGCGLCKKPSRCKRTPLPIRARGLLKSHVGASSGGPKHHDVVRLRAPSLHAGRADWHARNGKPDCARLVVEEPFERDGGNVALDDVAPDLRCVAGGEIVWNAEPFLHRIEVPSFQDLSAKSGFLQVLHPA